MKRGHRSQYDIPEIRVSSIERTLRNVTNGSSSPVISQRTLQSIREKGQSHQVCVTVVVYLMRIIDEFGSHTLPVYKALFLLVACLQSQWHDNFAAVCRVLLPEIQSILFLTFGTKSAPYRDRIHMMAASIFDHLVYKVELPDLEFYAGKWQFNAHRPSPPSDIYVGIEPEQFVAPQVSDIPVPLLPTDEDDQGDFASKPSASVAPNPSVEFDLMAVTPVSPSPSRILDDAPPAKEPPKEVGKTPDDLLRVTQLKFITQLHFDDGFESC
jgi:hypothetical protein